MFSLLLQARTGPPRPLQLCCLSITAFVKAVLLRALANSAPTVFSRAVVNTCERSGQNSAYILTRGESSAQTIHNRSHSSFEPKTAIRFSSCPSFPTLLEAKIKQACSESSLAYRMFMAVAF